MVVSLVIVFAASLGTSLLVTPWIRDLAIRWRVGDYPDKRKVHKTFIPRMGGVGIIAGLAAGIGVAALLEPVRLTVQGVNLPPVGLAFLLIIGLGIYDDVHGVGSLG